MKQESNDFKGLAPQILTYLGKSVSHALPADTLRMVVPMLVNGTKEKNTMIRVSSEFRLMALLRLGHGAWGSTYQVRAWLGLLLTAACCSDFSDLPLYIH